MTDYQRQANQLVTLLDLSLQPIAMAFCDIVPNNIQHFNGVVPAGCAFWQEAATHTFATSAKDHQLCSIGVHTHNMSGSAPSQQADLQAALQAMIGLDYVRQEEIAAIPVLQREAKYVVYGPLSTFPVAPEVVLLFADAQQGLVLSEAVARVDKGIPKALGRPACAIVPQVLNGGHAAMSLGCCGARAYLDLLSDDLALWALPASKINPYCEQIEVFSRANTTLSMFHRRRRKDVESGEQPTVLESLQRLGVG